MDEDHKAWYRPRNIAIATLILTVIGIIWIGIWARSVIWAKPTISFNAYDELNTYAAKDQPEGFDAWPILIEAAQRLVDADIKGSSGQSQTPGLKGTWEESRLEPDLARLDRMYELGVMDLAVQTIGMHRCVHTYPTQLVEPHEPQVDLTDSLWSLRIPELSYITAIGRGCVLSMRRSAEAAKPREIAPAFATAIWLGRHQVQSPILIEQITGLSMIQTAIGELQMELGEHKLDASACKAAMNVLDRFEPPNDYLLVVEWEYIAFLDMVQRMYTDDGSGDGILIISELTKYGDLNYTAFREFWDKEQPAPRIYNFLGYDFPRRAETVRYAQMFRDDSIKMAEAGVSRSASKIALSIEFPDDPVPRKYMFLKSFHPNMARHLLGYYRLMRASLQALRISLALELHRLELGSYPNTLAQLAPDFLADIPTDPTHDGPFIYRLVEDDPRGYILYSSGVNQIDSGNPKPNRLRSVSASTPDDDDHLFTVPRPPLNPDD